MISRVIGFEKNFSLADGNLFQNYEIMLPKLEEMDVIVKNLAVSINPVDTKLRQSGRSLSQPHVLGFDSVGIITELGSKVTDFSLGDRVLFAGTTKRYGSLSQYQVVDARIMAKLPQEIPTDEAAALPLTFITAYEMLFQQMDLIPSENGNQGTILIINGAGGVGSIAIQLAKWAGLSVIATASRKETIAWTQEMGADFVINHRKALTPQLKKIGYSDLPYILILHSTEQYFEEASRLLKPFGKIGSIVEPKKDLNMTTLKNKSGALVWEYMFAKTDAGYQLDSQGKILQLLVKLLASQKIHSTLTKIIPGFSPEAIFMAHQMLEKNDTVGKIVVHY